MEGFSFRGRRACLRDTLDAARRGTLPRLVQTRTTVADAAAEWLRYVEQDRDFKPSTLRDYRLVLNARTLPAVGDLGAGFASSSIATRPPPIRKLPSGYDGRLTLSNGYEAERRTPMTVSYSQEQIESRVVDALVSFGVEREAIAPETSLETLDVDSLDIVELAELLRDMGIDIEGRDFVDVRTFGDAMGVIVGRAQVS